MKKFYMLLVLVGLVVSGCEKKETTTTTTTTTNAPAAGTNAPAP